MLLGALPILELTPVRPVSASTSGKFRNNCQRRGTELPSLKYQVPRPCCPTPVMGHLRSSFSLEHAGQLTLHPHITMRGHRPQAIAAGFRGLLQESKPQFALRRYGTVTSATPPSVFNTALEANAPRYNWTREEIKEIYDTPLMNLAFAAVRSDLMTR